MTVSDGLKNRLEIFEQSGELKLSPEQKRELQKHCQEIFRFSIDIGCPDCLGKYANKFSLHLKELE